LRTISDHQKYSTQQPDSIERSPSYHVNVQRTSSVIVLPKNYNPIAQLCAIENMELFLSKTFHNVNNQQTESPIEKLSTKESTSYRTVSDTQQQDCGNATDGYTNRIFTQNYEALLCKENKMIQNLLQQRNTFPKSKRTQKQLLNEMKMRELQMLGCLIVELFLSNKLRAITGCAGTVKNFEQRLEMCVRILKYEFDSLPTCLQYPVKLLLGILNDEEENSASLVVTNLGLPVPSAQQLLQPILSNTLIPFSHNYAKLFTLVKSLHQFNETQRLLDLQTFFECDGKHCSHFEHLDRTRTAFTRKIAECKVKSTVVLIEGLLEINPHEQFRSVELLLPHIIDLLRNNETSILAAWYIFDPIAQCLGVKDTQKYLLEPILALYDVDTGDRKDFRIRNSEFSSSSTVRSGNSSFKSRKTIKLYHHSFLLRLIVRFGLCCFLENFTSPLIEAVGGKDPESDSPHLHEFRASCSQRNLKLNSNEEDLIEGADELSHTLVSPNDISDKSSEKTLSPSSVPTISTTSLVVDPQEEMFAFEGDENGKHLQIPQPNLDDSSDTDAEQAILKIIDQFELKSDGSSIDLKLNHSQAEEAFEYAAAAGNLDENFQINDFMYGDGLDQTKLFSSSCYSFEEDKISYTSVDSPLKTTKNLEPTADLKSPTIPIPSSFRKSIEVNSIGCEIGSKKSIDSGDFLSQAPLLREEYPKSSSSTTPQIKSKISKSTTESTSMYTSANSLKPTRSSRMSEMSSESLIWLSHRLGPVLTARYLTRNLLKMLTLCYVGQENLLPDDTTEPNSAPKLQNFTVAEGRVSGDIAAAKVLEVLVAVSALFGEQFILLQYFPVAIELISLCKKKITPSLEGGLISSLQLVKYLIPYLNDATIMDQLQDVILRGILHPIIRILASTKHCMPNGYLARNVLARKLVDCVYVLATRIGVQMAREHLDMALQRFFLIFDKAYGINRDDSVRDEKNEERKNPSAAGEESNFLEIRRDGLIQEWSIQGERIARLNSEDSLDSYTPPYVAVDANVTTRERAIEEIRDVFTPGLAHTTYLKFLKYLGEQIMCHTVKNIPVILNLCHEYQQILNEAKNSSDFERFRRQDSLEDTVDGMCSNSFGNNVIGNRIEVPATDADRNSEKEAGDLIAMVAYKLENVNSSRNLRGNWMAYWEHEVGRSDKDNRFNFKQIKLQTFTGHSNSVRSILALDNENSFLSASKDKTVKLWSCRSEGDGNKISSCQFTYLNHRKSVHSLAFLESFRWAVSCDSGVHIWDPYLGQHVGQLDTNKYSHVSVVKTFPSPSSLVICGTAESSVKLIDARTFKYINEWKVTSSATATVRCIAVAPSKNWIAVGLNSGQLVILDGRTGMILASWKACDGEILQLIAPNDNQLISSGLDHNISVWNTLDGSFMFNMRLVMENISKLIC
jgi:WD repeat-containing protein 81